MLKELAEFIKAREERITIAGTTFVVRELSSAVDLAVAGKDKDDIYYRIVVRSVFSEKGEQALGDEDIPALKGGSKIKLAPLYEAVNRVNGLNVEAEAKNSDAAPG